MRKFSLLLLLLVSCGNRKVEKVIASADIELLRVDYEARKLVAEKEFDEETGWPSADDCDGLLWAGLARAGGLEKVILDRGELEPGILGRNTIKNKGCDNSTSKDMVMGWLWGRYAEKNGAKIKQFADVSDAHNWRIGDGPIEKSLLTPNLIGLIGRLRCKLGVGCPDYKRFIAAHTRVERDFEQHLATLFILLDDAKKDGPLVSWFHGQHPNDALFSYAHHLYSDGDMSEPTALLLGDYQYPSYVRGSEHYKNSHWIFVASLLLQDH